MAGQKGYEYIKVGVSTFFTVAATGVILGKKGLELWKNKDEIIAEVQDTQLEEVVDLVTNEVREGITKVVAAFAS